MTFIKSGNNISGKEYILDAPAQQETFLQFIPATVKQVVNSGESVASPSNNDNESNCILPTSSPLHMNGATDCKLPQSRSTDQACMR